MRDTFNEYFNDGMIASEAVKYHEGIMFAKKSTESDFSNARMNPTARTVSFWYDEWRKLNLGPRTGPGLIQVGANENFKYLCRLCAHS